MVQTVRCGSNGIVPCSAANFAIRSRRIARSSPTGCSQIEATIAFSRNDSDALGNEFQMPGCGATPSPAPRERAPTLNSALSQRREFGRHYQHVLLFDELAAGVGRPSA